MADDRGRDGPGSPEREADTERAEKVAPVAGGVAGTLAGATAATLVVGPIGTILGAIAGAIGGWWLGAAARRETEISPEDERYYRTHYEAAPRRHPAKWEDARPAYELGHIAGANPGYAGRPFSEVEPDLQHGWRGDVRATYGDWSAVREMARAAYERRGKLGAAAASAEPIGTTSSHRRPPFADPLPPDSDVPGAVPHPGLAGNPADVPEPSSAARTGHAPPHPEIGPHAVDDDEPPRPRAP